MGREIVGLMACPECGHPDAQVKRSKAGLLYRYCPECDAQYFARTAQASDRLEGKARAPAQAPAPAPAQAPAPAPAPAPAAKPARAGGFSLGGLR